MKAARIVVCLCVLLMGLPGPAGASAAGSPEPNLRIGLGMQQAGIAVSSAGVLLLRTLGDQQEIRKYPANYKVFIVWKNKQLFIDNKPVKARQLAIVLANDKAAGQAIEVNDKAYRGTIEINSSANGFTVVNCIALEQYLYGVVPQEMPADWPAEALKAQAVAARTFALYSSHRHSSEGFDLCATTHCQAYGGKTAEKANSSAAVDATRGLAMLYNNNPICASFHTTSGGMTESSEEVWGTYLPYLRAVKDDDAAAPYHRWTLQFTPRQLQSKLEAAGYTIGKLQSMELSPLSEKGRMAADRSPTGRVKRICFSGDKGTAVLSGSEIRRVLSLKSTLFDMRLIVPAEKKREVPGKAYDKKDIAAGLPPGEAKGLNTAAKNVRRISGQDGEIVAIDGQGWGHALGLSQWGAQRMAKISGYEDILQHYYTAVKIKKIY